VLFCGSQYSFAPKYPWIGDVNRNSVVVRKHVIIELLHVYSFYLLIEGRSNALNCSFVYHVLSLIIFIRLFIPEHLQLYPVFIFLKSIHIHKVIYPYRRKIIYWDMAKAYPNTRQRGKGTATHSLTSETEERLDQSSGRDDQPGLTLQLTHPIRQGSGVSERLPKIFSGSHLMMDSMGGSGEPASTAKWVEVNSTNTLRSSEVPWILAYHPGRRLTNKSFSTSSLYHTHSYLGGKL
jgi:hypothetical protein